MADVLFDVDAAQIVAKLHFAGLQATRRGYANGAFFVNTGIKNDNPNGTPDNIGKTRFDLSNKSSRYQVGWIKPIEYEYQSSLDDIASDIEKLESMMTNEMSKDLLAKFSKEDDENVKSIQVLQNRIKKAFADNKIDDVDDKMLSSKDGIKKVKDKFLKLKDSNTSKNSFIIAFDEAKGEAVKFLADYMKYFAGPGNSSVDESSVGSMQVSNNLKGPNDKSLVKSFEIQPISAQEKGKVAAEAKANPKNAVATYCFYVNYSLNVEK